MAVPFKTFVDILVKKLNSNKPEIRKYLNLKPHIMSLESAYLSQLGLSRTQITEIHTLAKNKAKFNKSSVEGMPGWDASTETLLLIGGNNFERAKGISSKINKLIGKGSAQTTSLTISAEEPELGHRRLSTKKAKNVDSVLKNHGIDISADLRLRLQDYGIKGSISVLVAPTSIPLSKKLTTELTNTVEANIGITEVDDSILNSLVNSFLGKPMKRKNINKKASNKIKGKTKKTTFTLLPSIPDRLSSLDLFSLRTVLNASLHDAIQSNMKTSAAPSSKSYLRYQTGRFARSAKIVGLNISKKEILQVKYQYMRAPYETFVPGFAQGSYGRNPKRIISKSIRDIMTKLYNKDLKVRSTNV